ncbi:MAG: hypothetical protein FGM16_06855 [Flavobacterium sp.]|nr:hypothetical protein [Flavobacterium sp.]
MELTFQMDFGNGFQICGSPMNAAGIQLRVIFTDQHPNATIEGTDFEWVGQDAINLMNYYRGGLTGGRGVYEGVGLRIFGCSSNNNAPLMFFDGYIDLASPQAKFECDKVTAPCKETGRVDWLNDICRAIDFNFLAKLPLNSAGRIVPSVDYKLTPYCINSIPSYTQEMIMYISEFMLLKELYDVTKTIAQYINELLGDTSTAVATVGAASGTLIATIAKVVLYVTYLFLIIVAIVNMTKALISGVIQTKKSKACMRAEDMFKRICQYFGLNFASTILQQGTYKDTTWMPQKNVIPDLTNPLNVFKRPQDESVNFPNNPNVHGHYDGNCSDFIATMCQVFKAEIKILGNTLYFERWNYWNNMAQWKIPNSGAIGYTYNLQDPTMTNAAELPSNYLLMFATDQSELCTLERYAGTSWAATVSPLTIYNKKRLTHQNGVEVRLPCALAKRKEYLSKVEKLLNGVINVLYGFVNAVTSLINGLINGINAAIQFFGGQPATLGTIPQLPTNILNNRIGWLEVSGDSWSMPKIFIGRQAGSDWVIHQNNELYMSADQLAINFHGTVLATRGNQQLIYKNNTFKFCCDDYVKIINNNVVFDPLNRVAKITEFVWDLKNEQAVDVEYRVFTNFTNNLKETIVIDGN